MNSVISSPVSWSTRLLVGVVTGFILGAMLMAPLQPVAAESQTESSTPTREELLAQIQTLLQILIQLQQQMGIQSGELEGGTNASGVKVGDSVRVTDVLKVRDNSGTNGNLLGYVEPGISGKIKNGPHVVDGYTWWYVEWENNLNGWSAENWLRRTYRPDSPVTPSFKYSLADVSRVTVQNIDPDLGLADDEYSVYTITLTNGRVVKVSSCGFCARASFDQSFRDSGYTGNVDKLIAMAKVVTDTTKLPHFVKIDANQDTLKVNVGISAYRAASPATTCGPLSYGTIKWGDGNSETVYGLGCSSLRQDISASHAYADSGDYLITFIDTQGNKISRGLTIGADSSDVSTYVNFVSSKETYVENDDTTNADDEGRFELNVEVTAIGGDVYIGPELERGGKGDQVGFIYEIFNGSGDDDARGVATHSLSSSADRESDGTYRVGEGETEDFSIVVKFDPKQSDSYRVELESLMYKTEDGDVVQESLIDDDIDTDFLFINDANGNEALGTYIGYMNGKQFIRTENISRADALKNCKLNANNNRTADVRCTWKGKEIFNRAGETPSPVGDTKLHVVGAYEAKGANNGFCYSDWGTIDVNIADTAGESIILALNAYEPVKWHINNPDNVKIEEIIITGYNPQILTGDVSGVKKTWKTFYGGHLYTQGGSDGQGAFYDDRDGWPATIRHWASDCQKSAGVPPQNRRYLKKRTGSISSTNINKVVEKMADLTGLTAASKQYKYNGTTFTVK